MTKHRLIEDSPEDARRAQDAWRLEIEKARERQDDAHDAGLPALKRLFDIAQGNSGQCRKVAAFLLGLYNGARFPFDLTECRAVDGAIFDDMLLVLRMDSQLRAEVHTYFPNGGKAFEALADDWNLHKREWDAGSDGFVRRWGAYQCRIQAVPRGDRVMWRWSVERWDKGQDEWKAVAGDVEYNAGYAEDAIRKWFDRGGENPVADE